MSRDLSYRQRRILGILATGIEGQWVAFERGHLYDLVGGDSSNARRSVRGLIARRLVEELRFPEDPDTYLWLTDLGAISGAFAGEGYDYDAAPSLLAHGGADLSLHQLAAGIDPLGRLSEKPGSPRGCRHDGGGVRPNGLRESL